MIIGSLGTNPGFKLVNNTETPAIAEEFARAFKASRALPCDVPLGSHPGMYNMQEKYAKLGRGSTESVHRSGRLQARAGYRRSDVSRRARRAAEGSEAVVM